MFQLIAGALVGLLLLRTAHDPVVRTADPELDARLK
jgi:hypothetical protein